MGFLRIILIFILVYYVIKVIMRIFAPIMAKKMMEKAAKNFEDQFNNPYYKKRPATKEGETMIEKKPQESPRRENSQSGEYIDYEEVD